MQFEELVAEFERPKRVGNGKYIVACPNQSHGQGRGDKNPSLSITDKGDKALINCLVGCDTETILQTVGLSLRDLFYDNELFYAGSDAKPRKRSGGVNSDKLAARIQATMPLKTQKMSDVEAKGVDWLWPGFIPSGFFTLIEGVEGIGKTFMLLKLAAIKASGGMFPGSSVNTSPGNVLLLSAEDSAAYVLKPRLEALSAPCERIHALDEPLTLDKDGLTRLSLTIAEHDIALAVIDPLFSYVGAINLNSDNEIRSVTDRLNRIAEKYQCAIGGVRHLNKSKGYGDPRNAGLNGVGWRAGARSQLLVGHDPENKNLRAVTQCKNNLSPETGVSYGYQITPEGIFEFTGKSNLTADRMLAFKMSESIEDRSAKNEAAKFLKATLVDGSRKATDIFDEARKAGISEATLRRAKSSIGVKATKGEFAGQWLWALPPDEDDQDSEDDHEGAQGIESDHLRVNGATKPIYHNGLGEDAQVSDSERLRDHLPETRFRACDVIRTLHLCNHKEQTI